MVALCSRFHQPETDFCKTCVSDANIYSPMYSSDGWVRPYPLPEDFEPWYKQLGGLLVGLGVTLVLVGRYPCMRAVRRDRRRPSAIRRPGRGGLYSAHCANR